MTTQLWIGFGFLAALVMFLIISFFLAPKLSDDQRATMRFLTALCGGMSGGFLSGASVFEATWAGPTTKIAISGTVGFALFFVVFFFYGHVVAPSDSIELIVPENTNFWQALETAAKLANVTIDYAALTRPELSSQVTEGRVSSETIDGLLVVLRLRTRVPNTVRPYTVRNDNGIYRLTMVGGHAV